MSRRCDQRYELPPHVQLIDGGTQGLYLLHLVQRAPRLIVFDAIDYGLEPGTLQLVENDEVPRFMGATEDEPAPDRLPGSAVAGAADAGAFPRAILLIGVQPAELDDFGGSLRAGVKAAPRRGGGTAVQELAAWGCAATPRCQGVGEPLSPVALALNSSSVSSSSKWVSGTSLPLATPCRSVNCASSVCTPLARSRSIRSFIDAPRASHA